MIKTKRKMNANEPSKKVVQARTRGLSSDQRTNRWEIVCPHCDEIFEPPTTMFASQSFSCHRCLGESWINYNDYMDEI